MLVDSNKDKLDTGSYIVGFSDYSCSNLLHFNLHCSCFNKVLDIPMQEAHRNNALYNDRHSIARTIVQDRQHRSEEHTSELQSRGHLVCRLLLEKKKSPTSSTSTTTTTTRSAYSTASSEECP